MGLSYSFIFKQYILEKLRYQNKMIWLADTHTA